MAPVWSSRFIAITATIFACGGTEAEPQARAHASAATEIPPSEPDSTASSQAKEEPNRPTFEASARVRADAPQASAGASGPSPGALAISSCEPNKPLAGYEHCEAIEVIDGPPCELECWRERKVTAKDRCCEAPVHGAIFGKGGLLVEADACKYVDPSCAHTSDLKSIEAGFHFYSDSSPREVLLVQGGCEIRAMGHGYVPPGVAAWTGCPVAKRFRWNGSRFTPVK